MSRFHGDLQNHRFGLAERDKRINGVVESNLQLGQQIDAVRKVNSRLEFQVQRILSSIIELRGEVFQEEKSASGVIQERDTKAVEPAKVVEPAKAVEPATLWTVVCDGSNGANVRLGATTDAEVIGYKQKGVHISGHREGDWLRLVGEDGYVLICDQHGPILRAADTAPPSNSGPAVTHATKYGKERDCEWMFGDAATGLLGFHALAHLNPLRWSGSLPLDGGIEQLRKVQQHGNRPIIIKCPAGSQEHNFPTVEEAIDYLFTQKSHSHGPAQSTNTRPTYTQPAFPEPTVGPYAWNTVGAN